MCKKIKITYNQPPENLSSTAIPVRAKSSSIMQKEVENIDCESYSGSMGKHNTTKDSQSDSNFHPSVVRIAATKRSRLKTEKANTLLLERDEKRRLSRSGLIK